MDQRRNNNFPNRYNGRYVPRNNENWRKKDNDEKLNDDHTTGPSDANMPEKHGNWRNKNNDDTLNGNSTAGPSGANGTNFPNRYNGRYLPRNNSNWRLKNRDETLKDDIAAGPSNANVPKNKENKNNDETLNDNSTAGPSDVKATNRALDSKKTFPMGYKKLEEIVKNDSEAKLILNLSSVSFFLLLEQKDQITPDLMCLILDALAKASESSSEQEIARLLIHFYLKIIPKLNCKGNFYHALLMYSTSLAKHLDSSSRLNHVAAVQNLLKFLLRLQSTLCHKSYDVVQEIVNLFAPQIEYINRKGNLLNEEILELLKELNESVENFDRMKVETKKHEVLVAPPDDFRTIPIYLSTEDILHNHEPFIRKNVVEGNYVGGIDHYLDTQFRLLREDFVQPLRHGITEYVRLINKNQGMKPANYRIKDLNVYQNVRIVSSRMMQNEQVHLCTFDCKPFKNLRWQVSEADIVVSFVPNNFPLFPFR